MSAGKKLLRAWIASSNDRLAPRALDSKDMYQSLRLVFLFHGATASLVAYWYLMYRSWVESGFDDIGSPVVLTGCVGSVALGKSAKLALNSGGTCVLLSDSDDAYPPEYDPGVARDIGAHWSPLDEKRDPVRICYEKNSLCLRDKACVEPGYKREVTCD
jgi:hypothetical protein